MPDGNTAFAWLAGGGEPSGIWARLKQYLSALESRGDRRFVAITGRLAAVEARLAQLEAEQAAARRDATPEEPPRC